MLSYLSLPILQALAILFRTQRTSRMKFVIQKRETKLRLKLLNKQMSKCVDDFLPRQAVRIL